MVPETFPADSVESAIRKAYSKPTKVPSVKRCWVPTLSIAPNEYNPNTMTADQVQELILSVEAEGGLTEPILITPDNIITDGEQRWLVAVIMGVDSVPVVVVDHDDVHKRLATIRHNRARGGGAAELEAALSTVPSPEALSVVLVELSEPLGEAEETALLPSADELADLLDGAFAELLGDTDTEAGLEELLADALVGGGGESNVGEGAAVYEASLAFSPEEWACISPVLGVDPMRHILGLCRIRVSTTRLMELERQAQGQ